MIKHNIVSLGEILWDVLPDKELPGGAPLNVAYHLQKLSQRVAVVSSVGLDSHGQRLLQLMQRQQLITDYIQQDPVYATGKVYARMDEHNDMQYDIVHPVAWDHITWNASLENLLHDDDLQYMVYGTLLARNVVSRNALSKALQSRARKVLDINLRAPYYSREVLEWLILSCDLLKLNIAELELISSWYGNYATNEERIIALANHFSVTTIIVTLGGAGCMGYIQEQFYYQAGQSIKVADTIGSGDAFLAGFLSCQINQCTPEYSLAYANALGALVASKSGGCPEYDIAEITTMAPVF
ncbi:fructokinase [Chitinophaga sp. CF118]|uniref:PfkB family carbohydrate kinase n=1 Tax=Chitinophaga sp. CF118 TaxID=1884367 RepID=UPI0008E5F91D|nr:PfkB family carbohydrate kinase [Chitinophaga sp. CF118]SFD24507.1 fructokinase [Chitinophaga sp. CF118]